MAGLAGDAHLPCHPNSLFCVFVRAGKWSITPYGVRATQRLSPRCLCSGGSWGSRSICLGSTVPDPACTHLTTLSHTPHSSYFIFWEPCNDVFPIFNRVISLFLLICRRSLYIMEVFLLTCDVSASSFSSSRNDAPQCQAGIFVFMWSDLSISPFVVSQFGVTDGKALPVLRLKNSSSTACNFIFFFLTFKFLLYLDLILAQA